MLTHLKNWRQSPRLKQFIRFTGHVLRRLKLRRAAVTSYFDLDALPPHSSASTDGTDCFREMLPGSHSNSLEPGPTPFASSDTELSWMRRPAAPTRPLGFYRLRDVRFGGRAYAMKGKRVCYAPSVIQTYWRELLDAHPWSVPRSPSLSPKKISTPAVLFVSRDYNSYGHWWLDIAPRLYVLWRLDPMLLKEAAIVVPNDLAPWALDTLDHLFGISPKSPNVVSYDPDEEIVNCRSALIPTMLHTDHDFHPAATEFYDHVRNVCAADRCEVNTRGLIYVTRSAYAKNRGTGVRQLANAAEAEALAVSLGFELVAPEELSWRRQVALFSKARVAVGEHGSGLKNLLFSSAGTIGVVINHLNDNQSQIAALKRQQYVVLETQGFDPSNHRAPYTVDLRKLQSRLEWALEAARA